jgi:hypothetical protein
VGGPLRSLQLIMKVPPRSRQRTSDTADIDRQRSIFASVGRKLVQRQTDRLGGGRIQVQLGAVDSDPRSNICKVRELGAHESLVVNAVPGSEQ